MRMPGRLPLYPAACAGLALALFGLGLLVARREWFFGDDFIFLAWARAPFDLGAAFWPSAGHPWWSYRPLTTHVFFSGHYAVFGAEPFPYLVTCLALHFCGAAFVWRIAGQLGFERRVALATGLLAAGAYPSLPEVFWISAVQHFGLRLFFLAAISFQLDFLRGGRLGFLLASCAATAGALFSHELGVTLAAVLAAVAFCARADRATRLRAALPQCVGIAVFACIRWGVIGPRLVATPETYSIHLGPHLGSNLARYAWILVHESVAVAVLVGALVAAACYAVSSDREGRAALLRRFALLGFWAGVAIAPAAGAVIGFDSTNRRMALLAEPAFILAIGAALDPLARSWGRARPAAFAGALLALCIAMPPYAHLLARARAPQGDVPRQLVEQVGALGVPVKRRGCVSLAVLGEWSDTELARLRMRTGGSLLMLYPGESVDLRVDRGVAKGCDVSLELTREGAVQLPGGRRFRR